MIMYSKENNVSVVSINIFLDSMLEIWGQSVVMHKSSRVTLTLTQSPQT